MAVPAPDYPLEEMGSAIDSLDCWCKSGKAYGVCHKRPSEFNIPGGPHTGPTTLVQRNGKWEPAGITANVVIGGMNASDVHEDLEELFGTICRSLGDQTLIDALHDVKHKMYGVRFHAAAIEARIAEEERRIRDGPAPASGAGWHRFDPELVFHFEALLLQLKATVDILMQVVSEAYPEAGIPRSFKSTEKASKKIVGGKAIRAMQRIDARLGVLFETARATWLQYAVLLRDRVTHRSRLKHLSSFVQRAHEGGGDVAIEYPSIPSGMRLDEYAATIDTQLTSLVRDALNLMSARLAAK